MEIHVHDDNKLRHWDSTENVSNDTELYLKTFDETYVYDEIKLLFARKDN